MDTQIQNNAFEKKQKLFNPKVFVGLAVIVILLGISLTTYFFFIKKSGQQLTTSATSFVSEFDTQSQSTIKNLTAFDWSNLPTRPNGSEKQALAVLLLLYSEETAAFRPEITATNLILPDDISKHQLVKLNTDVTRENMQKMIENLISIETIYSEKGLMPAKTHIERLRVLKTYFTKNLPQQKYKVPEGAEQISSGIKVADNQLDYAKALITRYNNWLSTILDAS